MKSLRGFSFARWWGIVLKEFLQLRRDRLTFGMIIGLPIVQLALFGFAINTDPKNLPTAIIQADHSDITRSIVSIMENSGYFRIVAILPNEEAGRQALKRGNALFVVSIPPDFTRKFFRGETPALLIEADATDPLTTGNALSALTDLPNLVAIRDRIDDTGQKRTTPFEVRIHRMYNPEGITQYNTVPGLMGVILTLTMVMMTGLAITRERERGTMENLLSTPVLPLEVMTGKIIPYVAIGLIQATIILLAARFIFHVPFLGSIPTLYLGAMLFIIANLSVGITLSSLAKNQLQAMQLAIFYFLPNLLLSGFMFPFQGMPGWAQTIGSILPLTHFNRLVRGLLLKENSWGDLWPNLWPMLAFTIVIMVVANHFYRRTLD